MRIGVLTYYRVINFGANLQAISTYRYLEQAGHEPIFIHYMSQQLYATTDGRYDTNEQAKTHLDFVDSVIKRQTETCFTAEDVNRAIEKYGIEAIVIGSDAVLQHHPLWSRVHIGGRIKRIVVKKVTDDRMFPNLFWGDGLNPSVKKALMSVSCQCSAYNLFSSKLKLRMSEALSRFSYISVRDTWTQQMIKAINNQEVPVTPDPVFAFKHYASDLIPDREQILEKFKLPKDYVLVSFMNVKIPENIICGLKERFSGTAACVALPSHLGLGFSHNYDYEIPLPLNPIDWYALITYSSGYIGNNMHPIVVALSNGVPCFSIDNWANYDFWNKPKDDGASKIEDLLKYYRLKDNRVVPYKANTNNLDLTIYEKIVSFPKEAVSHTSQLRFDDYKSMMETLLNSVCP